LILKVLFQHLMLVYSGGMSSSTNPIPKASLPPTAMGCLASLLLLPFAIVFFPAILICRLAGKFANRG
jgi:hypothetical protein